MLQDKATSLESDTCTHAHGRAAASEMRVTAAAADSRSTSPASRLASFSAGFETVEVVGSYTNVEANEEKAGVHVETPTEPCPPSANAASATPRHDMTSD